MSQSPAERTRKKFWVVDTESVTVTEVECLSCGGDSQLWFCPKYGFTGSVDVQLFEERRLAVRELVNTTKRRLDLAEDHYQKALSLQ